MDGVFWLMELYTKKKNLEYISTGMFVIKSPAIELITKTTQTVFPILDNNFIYGKMPWDQLLTDQQKKLWYPTGLFQQQTINTFIKSGPYIPKYDYLKSSTWELIYKYTSYFKWGGPELTDQPVQDPCTKQEFDVTDNLKGTIQIQDPLKQKYQQLLRAWDVRRGFFTKTKTIKRIVPKLRKLIHLSTLMKQNLQKKKKRSYSANQTPRRRKPRNQQSTPLTLRRKYMPRPKSTKPHPVPAAAAAAAPQRPHRHHPRPKEQTENSTTTNRHKLTPFKPGFETETEHQLAYAFSRPPRLFKEDPPFYPWLPRFTPIVNFHLNFKG